LETGAPGLWVCELGAANDGGCNGQTCFRMKKALRYKRLVSILFLAVLLAGCRTIQPTGVANFSAGVSAAKGQTSLAFQAVTDLTSASIIDYAASRPTLTDNNFLPVLDPASLAVWDMVFTGLQKYSQNLALLTSPDLTKGYEDGAVNLATEVKQVGADLKKQKMIPEVPSFSPSLARAFTELGDLLLRARAQHDAKAVLTQTDPTIKTIFTTMADAIGTSQMNNLRGTVSAHWQQRKAILQGSFLIRTNTPADRRTIAAQYASLLNGQTTQDLALASLQRTYLALVDAHHALAQGSRPDALAAIAAVEQEVQNTQNLINRFNSIPTPK
jgi:hypothetical protein